MLKHAILSLPEEKKQEALRAVKRLRPAEDLYLKRNRTGELAFENKFFRLELNPETASADTIYLKANRFRFKNSGLFMYETFDRNDYERFRHQYLRLPDAEWAIRDFTKPDLPAKTKKQQFEGFQSDVYKTLWGHGCRITFATENHPGFRRIEIDYILPDEEDYLEIRLKWFAKIPHRLPHAAWFSFVPANGGRNCMLKKMEEWIAPADVVSRGGRTLHAVEKVLFNNQASIENLDSPLVAPGSPSLLDFHNRLPRMRGGVHFNLYNNVWGTNFPMWFRDNMTFRFRIRAIGKN